MLFDLDGSGVLTREHESKIQKSIALIQAYGILISYVSSGLPLTLSYSITLQELPLTRLDLSY